MRFGLDFVPIEGNRCNSTVKGGCVLARNEDFLMRSLGLAAICVILGAASAGAGGYTVPVTEAPVVPVAAAPARDWAGPYAGLTLGYAFGGDDDIGYSRNNRMLGDVGKYELSGFNAGLQIGYRWQKDRWVFGPELGILGGNIKDSFDADGYHGENKLKNAIELRLKTGYLINPETMLFGVAGVSRAKFDYSMLGSGGYGDAAIDDSFSRTGYVLGLGVERRLTDSLSLTGSYEYANYGKETLDDGTGISTRATPKFGNVKIGVNFNF